MSNERTTAGKTAKGRAGGVPYLEDVNAEMIAFLPDSVVIRGTIYYRLAWTYAGEGDNLARVGYGWARSSAVPSWATPGCGSARRGSFVLGGVHRRGPTSTSRHGWDLLIDEITDAKAEGRAE